MIGLEQWRASIGLYHSGKCRQLAQILGKKQLEAIIVQNSDTVEQSRASIGVYHSGSYQQQLAQTPGKRHLASITVYQLLVILVLVSILAELLVHGPLFVIWMLINDYSLPKEGLIAFKNRTSGTQLLVSVCIIGLAVMENNSGSLERSVRAMAILLIMAGDVEQNPGPLPPASASPESRALRYHSASLITAITDPLRLSWKLFSEGMIEKTTKDKANIAKMTTDEKNDVLLSAVMSRVDSDCNLFHRFVDLLKKDGDVVLGTLAGKLEGTYSAFNIEDKGRCTQNPPPMQQQGIPINHIGAHSYPQTLPSYFNQPSYYLSPSNLPQDLHNIQTYLPPLQPPPLHSHHSQPVPIPSQYHHFSPPYYYPNSLQPYQMLSSPTYLQTAQPLSPPLQFLVSQPPSPSLPPSQPPSPPPSLPPSQLTFPPSLPPSQPTFPPSLPPSQPPSPPPSLPPSQPTFPPSLPPSQPPSPPPSLPPSQPPSPPPSPHPHPSPPAGESSQSPLSLFIKHLRAFYQTSELPPDDKWPPSPSEKFINLAVISREKVSTEELERFKRSTLHGNVDDVLEIKAPIKMEDILKSEPGKTLQCVVVVGAPGVGKTTLAWTICTQWGRGKLFQQFAMVILVTLRDMTVQNAKTMADLIFYDDEDGKRQILQHLTHTDGKDTLIVLEGLDELPQHLLTQSSIFTQLLSGKNLTRATILITSRPSATVQLWKNWKRRVSRHIEVLGFTEKDVDDYIENSLFPQELVDFKDYLSTNPAIKLMMYIPILAAIVIAIFKCCHSSSRPFPTTTTELYTRLVQTILFRYLDSHPDCKLKDDKADIDEFTDLLPPVSDHFYKLTRMAFDSVTQQKLTFHNQSEAIEHLGFMDTVTERIPYKRSVSYSYNFLHLSVQEYLAAYFVSLQSVDVQQQQLQAMCTEPHLRNMCRFVAGITKFKGMDRAIIKAIIEKECKQEGGSLKLSPNTLQLLHESRDYSIIEGHPSYSCRLTDYSTLLEFSVLGHCIANSSYNWTLTLGDRGQHMQSTDRTKTLVQTLKSHSNPSYTIEEITCYYDTPECAQHLLLGLPQYALKKLKTLALVSNSTNPQPLPLCVLKCILSEMCRLRGLGLCYGAVSTREAIAIADVIKHNNTLRVMEFWNNSIGDEGIKALDKIRELKKDLSLHIDKW